MKFVQTLAVMALTGCSAAFTASQSLAAPQQPAKPEEGKAAWPAANPKDVESFDAILKAVYDVISGPAGERDWNRFRSLFIPYARLIAVTLNTDGTFSYRGMSVEDYVRRAGEYFLKSPFYEQEISRKTESFGHISQVFSTYASRETPDGKPFQRGINSMQLFFDGKRWWVVSIFWDSERPGTPIPQRYLAN